MNSQAEMDAYKAYVAWLTEAQRVRQLFSDADVSLPDALVRLFCSKEKPRPRKPVTK